MYNSLHLIEAQGSSKENLNKSANHTHNKRFFFAVLFCLVGMIAVLTTSCTSTLVTVGTTDQDNPKVSLTAGVGGRTQLVINQEGNKEFSAPLETEISLIASAEDALGVKACTLSVGAGGQIRNKDGNLVSLIVARNTLSDGKAKTKAIALGTAVFNSPTSEMVVICTGEDFAGNRVSSSTIRLKQSGDPTPAKINSLSIDPVDVEYRKSGIIRFETTNPSILTLTRINPNEPTTQVLDDPSQTSYNANFLRLGTQKYQLKVSNDYGSDEKDISFNVYPKLSTSQTCYNTQTDCGSNGCFALTETSNTQNKYAFNISNRFIAPKQIATIQNLTGREISLQVGGSKLGPAGFRTATIPAGGSSNAFSGLNFYSSYNATVQHSNEGEFPVYIKICFQ